MSTVYLAARYSRRLELCAYRSDLECRDHKVPARWLLGEHQAHGLEASRAIEADGPVPAEQAVLFAEDDIADIIDSDVLIAFTEAPRSGATRGGRHTEFGFFLGLKVGGDYDRRIYVVGPLEHIFYCLPEVNGRFDDWGSLLSAYDKAQGWP